MIPGENKAATNNPNPAIRMRLLNLLMAMLRLSVVEALRPHARVLSRDPMGKRAAD